MAIATQSSPKVQGQPPNLPPMKAIAIGLKKVIASVFGPGITRVLTFALDEKGGVNGKFHKNEQVYDYSISSQGEIEYLEAEANGQRSDSFLIGYYVDSGALLRGEVKRFDTKIKGPKNCGEGKQCGDSCVKRGYKCRTKLPALAMVQFQKVQRALNQVKSSRTAIAQAEAPSAKDQVKNSRTTSAKDKWKGKSKLRDSTSGAGLPVGAILGGAVAAAVVGGGIAASAHLKDLDKKDIQDFADRIIENDFVQELVDKSEEVKSNPGFLQKLASEVAIQTGTDFVFSGLGFTGVLIQSPPIVLIASIARHLKPGEEISQAIREKIKKMTGASGFDSKSARVGTLIGVRMTQVAVATYLVSKATQSYQYQQERQWTGNSYQDQNNARNRAGYPPDYSEFEDVFNNDPDLQKQYEKAVENLRKQMGYVPESYKESVKAGFYSNWKKTQGTSKTSERSSVHWSSELKIDKNASLDEIKAAYRKLSKTVHPDLNKDDPKAAEKFDKLTKAYKMAIASQKNNSRQDSLDWIDIVLDEIQSLVKRRYDADGKPTRAGYTWVDDKRVKKGGYWRKLPKGKKPERSNLKSRKHHSNSSGIVAGLAVTGLAGVAAGAIAHQRNSQTALSNVSGLSKVPFYQSKAFVRKVTIAGGTTGAVVGGLGLAVRTVQDDLKNSSVPFDSIRQPPGGIPDEETLKKYDTFQPGDLIRKSFKSERMGSRQHYAVYVGKDPNTGEHMLIDTGEDWKDRDSVPYVRRRGLTWDAGPNDTEYEVVPPEEIYRHGTPKFLREEILERADKMLYQRFTYKGFESNCEAFARGIVEGKAYSIQGEKVNPLTRFVSSFVTDNILKLRMANDYFPGADKETHTKVGKHRIVGPSNYATETMRWTAQEMVDFLEKDRLRDIRRKTWEYIPNPYTGKFEGEKPSLPAEGETGAMPDIASAVYDVTLKKKRRKGSKWKTKKQRSDADDTGLPESFYSLIGLKSPDEFSELTEIIANQFPAIANSLRVEMYKAYLMVLFTSLNKLAKPNARRDAAEPTRAGYTWVDDTRVKGGGYWRKLPKGQKGRRRGGGAIAKLTGALVTGAALGAAGIYGSKKAKPAIVQAKDDLTVAVNTAAKTADRRLQGAVLVAGGGSALAGVAGGAFVARWASEKGVQHRVAEAQRDANKRVASETEQIKQQLEAEFKAKAQEAEASAQASIDGEVSRRTAEAEQRIHGEALTKIEENRRKAQAEARETIQSFQDQQVAGKTRKGALISDEKQGIALAASTRRALDLNSVSKESLERRFDEAVDGLVAKRLNRALDDLAGPLTDQAKAIRQGSESPAVKWQAMENALIQQANRENAIAGKLIDTRTDYRKRHRELLNSYRQRAAEQGGFNDKLISEFDKELTTLNQTMQTDINRAIAESLEDIKLDAPFGEKGREKRTRRRRTDAEEQGVLIAQRKQVAQRYIKQAIASAHPGIMGMPRIEGMEKGTIKGKFRASQNQVYQFSIDPKNRLKYGLLERTDAVQDDCVTGIPCKGECIPRGHECLVDLPQKIHDKVERARSLLAQVVEYAKSASEADRMAASMVREAFETEQLPSRKQAAQLLGTAAKEVLKNPVQGYKRGMAREKMIREAMDLVAGIDASRMNTTVAGAKASGKVVGKLWEDNKEELTVNTVGFLGSQAGAQVGAIAGAAVAGPVGAAVGGYVGARAGDLGGALTTRKIVTQQKAHKRAIAKLNEDESFESLDSMSKQKQAKKQTLNELEAMAQEIEDNDLGDKSGWLIGNGSADLLNATGNPLSNIPAIGGGVAFATVPSVVKAKNRIKAGEDRDTVIRETLEEIAKKPLKMVSGAYSEGNQREAELRQQAAENIRALKKALMRELN